MVKPIRHYVIPDVQVRPGDVTDHLDWIAQDIIRRKPDVIVCIGDFWDMPSMSSYSDPGSLEKEGARLVKDLEAGNEAMDRLIEPIQEEMEKTKRQKKKHWNPRFLFTLGNHEDRIDRLAKTDARFEGVVGNHLFELEDWGWERYKYLQPVQVDGVWYAHFWQSSHSARPIGGTIDNRLNKLGFSFVQGHEQGKKYGDRMLPNGKTIHGMVVGSCYLDAEAYRGPQGKTEWRGVAVLNDVRDGDYEPMFLTLRYLCREYTGMELHDYMTTNYPEKDWEHLR